MKNNTFEDYKKAIRKKYEMEKEGVYFNFLIPPSQANLRKLCWEIFKSNESKDDLSVFSSFFEFEFDIEKKNSFNDQTDRFRPIGSFYKGEKVPSNRYAVELAAILVDYQPRPFKKFKEKGIILIEEPIGSPKVPIAFGINDEEEEEEEIEIEKENGSFNYQAEQITNFGNEETYNYDQEKEEGNEKQNFITPKLNLVEEEKKEKNSKSEIKPVTFPQPRLSLFEKIKEKILYNFLHRLRNTAIATIFIFGLIITVIYFAFFKNHCMQWSDDHYEVVDCSSIIGKNTNEIIPIDNDLLDFRKLKACDTTTCFKKNGEAFVWYGKTPNGVDFFNDNGNGRHPECKSSLRPVTQYMYNKYLKDKPCK